jgi:hypothetical protein
MTTAFPATARWSAAVFAVVLVCAGAAVAAPAVAAPVPTSIVVTSLADTADPGTLRSAFEAAELTAGDDVITFAVTGTIALESPLPPITQGGIAIDGPGSAALTIRTVASGQPLVFAPDGAGTVQLTGITISGGRASVVTDFSGAPEDVPSELTLSDVVINGADNGTGGFGLQGLLVLGGDNRPTVTITNSSFLNTSGDGGVLITDAGPVVIDSSTFDGNSATQIGGGLLLAGATSASIVNSTFSRNKSDGAAGALYASQVESLDILQSTFSGNSAADVGGAILLMDIRAATLDHSTVTANSSEGADGAAVFVASATLAIDSSIVTANTAESPANADISDYRDVPPAVDRLLDKVTIEGKPLGDVVDSSAPRAAARAVGDASSIAHSLVGQAAGNPTLSEWTVSTTLFGVDAELGPLANNGGRTLTHLPAAGSPAIDGGDLATLAGLTTDQRGSARVVGGLVDIGSVERAADPVPQPQLAFSGAGPLGPLLAGAGALLLIVGLVFLILNLRRSRRRGAGPQD